MSSLNRFDRLMLYYPVLWDPSDFNYRDNTMKMRAREELLVQANRLSRVQLTMADLKRKIRSFCSNRRRKMIRWEDGIVTNASQCKEVQRQYYKLYHARSCLVREQSDEYNGEECPMEYCRPMRALLNHMTICQAGEFCTTPDCNSFQNIRSHWVNCRKEICPICRPQKEWHKTMTTDQRNNIVDIMLQSVSSNTISPVIHDQLLYVKSKESDIFKTVNSFSEYYRAVAEKIWQYELQKAIIKQTNNVGCSRSVCV